MVIGRWIKSALARHAWIGASLTGAAIVILGSSPVLAGFEAEHPTPPPGQAVHACSNSTSTIRQLAMIDHTSDGGFQCLGVFVEDGTVKAIRLERHSYTAFRGERSGEEQVKVVEFPPTIVDSARGAVIDGIPGHDAIVLHGHFASPADKGELEISYLYNGLTGDTTVAGSRSTACPAKGRGVAGGSSIVSISLFRSSW